MKIISFANNKGGVGKSTCAAHIALEMTNENKKVILIDLDPQKTLEKWWEKRQVDNPKMIDVTEKDIYLIVQKINNKDFDYLLIDTSAGKTSIVEDIALELSDMVIVPCKPTAPDLNAIIQMVDRIKKKKKQFLFIITQAIPRAKNTMDASLILENLGTVIPQYITNRVDYVNAMLIGSTASKLNNIASLELQNVWKFIENQLIKGKNHDRKTKF